MPSNKYMFKTKIEVSQVNHMAAKKLMLTSVNEDDNRYTRLYMAIVNAAIYRLLSKC